MTQMPGVMAFEMEDLRFLPKRASHSNKGSFGKLLLIAGSVDMAGAAVLSAKAAYTAGCGLVRGLRLRKTAFHCRQVFQRQF